MISLKKIILVESWKTYNLSNNPKTLLYDFYVLSYLSTLPISSVDKGFRGNLIGRDPVEVKLDIEHAQNVLFNPLIKKLKSAIFVALTAEIRHVFDREQDFSLFRNNELFKNYTRYYFELRGDMPPEFHSKRDIRTSKVNPSKNVYKESLIAASKAITKTGKSREAFAELCAKIFTEMDWYEGYGGEKWKEIANAYMMLNNASSYRDKQIAIDHAFDLQHNTGTVLNKVKEFQIDGSYEWLDTALSLKRDVDSMYKLLPYCSSDMRRLANEVFKIANISKGSIVSPSKSVNKNFSQSIDKDPDYMMSFDPNTKANYAPPHKNEENKFFKKGDIVLVRDQYSDKFGTGVIISIEPTMTTGEHFYNVKIQEPIGKYEAGHTYTLTQHEIKAYDSSKNTDDFLATDYNLAPEHLFSDYNTAHSAKGNEYEENKFFKKGDIVLVRDQFSDKFGNGIIVSVEPMTTTDEQFYNVKIYQAIGKYEAGLTYTLTQHEIKAYDYKIYNTAYSAKGNEYEVHDIVNLHNKIYNMGYGTGAILSKTVDLNNKLRYEIKIMGRFGPYSKNSVHVFYPADIHSKIGKWAFDANNLLLNMENQYVFDLDDLEDTSLIKGKYNAEYIIVKPLEVNITTSKNKLRCEIIKTSNKNIPLFHVGQIISLNPKKLYKKANLDINV
jgi:hypothetical protein